MVLQRMIEQFGPPARFGVKALLQTSDPEDRMHRTRLSAWVGGLCITLAAVAVSAQPQAVELALNEPLDLSWSDGGHQLSVEWTQVSDSRCPTDAVCVWAGEVEIRLALVPAGAEGAEVVLRLPTRDDISAETSIDGFHLRLDRVTPEASLAAPPTPDTYRAHLTVAPPGTALPAAATAIRSEGWAEMKLRTSAP